MPINRLSWEDLPETTRREVEQNTGPISSARTVAKGRNSAVATILETQQGRVFVKGLHRSHPRSWTQDMEEMINPHVLNVSPLLLWRVSGEWDLLGFECVDGRQADYAPESADLPKLIATFVELSEIPCPDLPLKLPEHRWRSYVSSPADLDWFQGDRLLHIDPTPQNLLIAGSRATIVDWAWPMRGALWIDPASLVIRLIEAGHSAEQAEDWIAGIPAWAEAPAEGLYAFAQANFRMWREVSNDRSRGIARAAKRWLEHRASLLSKSIQA